MVDAILLGAMKTHTRWLWNILATVSVCVDWGCIFMHIVINLFIKIFWKFIFHNHQLNRNNLLEVCLQSALNVQLIIHSKLNGSL